jgi:alpha-beta hydrolase superfamily lysophospholipase
MGGLLALNLAAHHPELNGVVSFAPALSINGLAKSRIARLFVKTTPKNTWRRVLLRQKIFPWQGYSVVPSAEQPKLFGCKKRQKDPRKN